jgi:hypothetical protein
MHQPIVLPREQGKDLSEHLRSLQLSGASCWTHAHKDYTKHAGSEALASDPQADR